MLGAVCFVKPPRPESGAFFCFLNQTVKSGVIGLFKLGFLQEIKPALGSGQRVIQFTRGLVFFGVSSFQ